MGAYRVKTSHNELCPEKKISPHDGDAAADDAAGDAAFDDSGNAGDHAGDAGDAGDDAARKQTTF